MLKIFFNYDCRNMEGTAKFLRENGLVEAPKIDEYFDSVFKCNWITTEFAKKVIKAIDKTEVITENVLKSPVLGTMPPQWLSDGTKGLLLLKYDTRKDVVLRSNAFGNNCAPYILEIAREKDIVLIGRHLINFGEFTDDIEVLNVPKVCHGHAEYIQVCREVLR